MRWYKVVFSTEDSIDPDQVMFQRQIRRLIGEYSREIEGLTIFRQVTTDPPAVIYFFPSNGPEHIYLFSAFRLQESEPPNRDMVQLFLGGDGDLDRYFPEPEKPKIGPAQRRRTGEQRPGAFADSDKD